MNTPGSDSYELGDDPAALAEELETRVLAECRDAAAVIAENTESTMADARGDNTQRQITLPMLHEIASLPPDRMIKIFEIRYKLARGAYDIDERLDAVLDRILADIKI